MIKENTKYKKEELKDILDEATVIAVDNLSKEFTNANHGNIDQMSTLMFQMQAMLAISEMKKILLGKEEE